MVRDMEEQGEEHRGAEGGGFQSEGVAENVRCSLDILKGGTVHFMGQYNEKGIVVLILYMKQVHGSKVACPRPCI